MNKVYFSINNGNPGGAGFAAASAISAAFLFRDNNGNELVPKSAGNGDDALFYLEVNPGTNGGFLKVSKMEQYNLCFANISNTLWFAEKNYCGNTDFTAAVTRNNSECFTRLTAVVAKPGLRWSVMDGNRSYTYSDQSVIDLPATISPNAIVTLTDDNNCLTSKRLGDDPAYLRNKAACASGAMEAGTVKLSMYPNPSSGVFYCMNAKLFARADEIQVTSSQGIKVKSFKDTSEVDISNLPSGMYYYQCRLNGQVFNGKLVKL
jgi:hypothetical protein